MQKFSTEILRQIGGFLLVLAVVVVGLREAPPAHAAPRGPTTTKVVDSAAVASAATTTSDPFFLKDSENFAVEVDTESGTATYDLILQYRGSDGAWHDDPEGDIVSSETDSWDMHTITADYTVLPVRLKLTNDHGSSATFSLWVHQDNDNAPGR